MVSQLPEASSRRRPEHVAVRSLRQRAAPSGAGSLSWQRLASRHPARPHRRFI